MGESRAFCEVSTVDERGHKCRYFGRVGRTVRVERDDYVAVGGGETASQCVALASSGLVNDPDVGPEGARGFDRAVYRPAVDDDDLERVGVYSMKDVREVLGFVERGYDDAYTRCRGPHRS